METLAIFTTEGGIPEYYKQIDFVFDSAGSFVSPRSISDTLRTNGTMVDKETVGKYLDALFALA